jgi:hypothetical protein
MDLFGEDVSSEDDEEEVQSLKYPHFYLLTTLLSKVQVVRMGTGL